MLELIQTRILSVPFWLPQVFVTFNSAKLFTRALLCVATVAPAGLLMGLGFPINFYREVSMIRAMATKAASMSASTCRPPVLRISCTL